MKVSKQSTRSPTSVVSHESFNYSLVGMPFQVSFRLSAFVYGELIDAYCLAKNASTFPRLCEHQSSNVIIPYNIYLYTHKVEVGRKEIHIYIYILKKLYTHKRVHKNIYRLFSMSSTINLWWLSLTIARET